MDAKNAFTTCGNVIQLLEQNFEKKLDLNRLISRRTLFDQFQCARGIVLFD